MSVARSASRAHRTAPHHDTTTNKKVRTNIYNPNAATNALVVVVAQLVVRREVSQQRAVNQQHLLVVGASRRAQVRENTRTSRQHEISGCHHYGPGAVPPCGAEKRSRC